MDKPKPPRGYILKEGEDYPDEARAKGKTEIKLTDEMKAAMEGLKEKENYLEINLDEDTHVTVAEFKRMEERIMKEIKFIKDGLFGNTK